ncbi:MAG: hypothetical protein KAQ66_01925 [Rhodospirillaceae bacterium]|nr:hypothetical protein [Rhodospirillaceae bacterium]
MLRSILSITVLALALGFVSGNASAAEDTSTLGSNLGSNLGPNPAKAFKGEQCVEPVDVMRREHMNMLKHQRDETLREGIRGNKYGLNECVDCHATKSPEIAGGNIRTVKPFCAECHQFAAVKIDCFECHTGTATGKRMKNLLKPKEQGKNEHGENAMVVGMLEQYLNEKASVQEGGK